MELLRARLGELRREGHLDYNSIESIRTEFGHSIELVERWSEPGQGDFNCVMYALGLRGDPLLEALADVNDCDIYRATPGRNNNEEILADTEFLEFCIAEGAMPPISKSNICPGDLLLYVNEGKCEHIGKFIDYDRLRSKWGPNDLLEHGPREVPDCYGNNLRRAAGISHEQSWDLFVEYAWSVVDDDPRVKERLSHIVDKYR